MLRALLLSLFLAAPLTAAADALPIAPQASAPAANPTPAAPAPAAAAPSASPAAHPDASAPSLDDSAPTESAGYLLFKTVVVLGIVVAFIYLTLNVGARKLLKLNAPGNALVKVIDRVPLDPKKSLYVLHVAGEFMLVGAAEQGLNLLCKLDPEAVQKLLAERIQAKGPSRFLEKLNALRSPAGASPSALEPRKPE
jgi:flagellar protein FliO/FliZ